MNNRAKIRNRRVNAIAFHANGYSKSGFAFLAFWMVMSSIFPALACGDDARSGFIRFCKEKHSKLEELHEKVKYESYFLRRSDDGEYFDVQFRTMLRNGIHSVGRLTSAKEVGIIDDVEEWQQQPEFADLGMFHLITISNPRYLASIRKNPTTDLFAIANISKYDPSLMNDVEGQSILASSYLRKKYLELAKDSSVDVEAWGEAEFNGRPVMRAVFATNFEGYANNKEKVRHEVLFGLDFGECLQIKSTWLNNGAVEKQTLSYVASRSDVPIPSAKSYEYIDKQNPANNTRGITIFRHYQTDHASDLEQYFLPHYGLTEPEEFREKPSLPFWSKLVALGLLFVVLSFVLSRFVKR